MKESVEHLLELLNDISQYNNDGSRIIRNSIRTVLIESGEFEFRQLRYCLELLGKRIDKTEEALKSELKDNEYITFL